MQRVLDLLALCGRTVNLLTSFDASHVPEVKQQAEIFVAGCEEVKGHLLSQLENLSVTDSAAPYRNSISTYSARKELDIAAHKTALVRSHLESLLRVNLDDS